MSDPVSTASPAPISEAFNALGMSVEGAASQPLMPTAHAVESMGVSQEELLATFFGDGTEAAPVTTAAPAGEGVTPSPLPGTAGQGGVSEPAPLTPPASGAEAAPISSQPGATPPASTPSAPAVAPPAAPVNPAAALEALRIQGMEAELARYRAAGVQPAAPAGSPAPTPPAVQEGPALTAPAYNLDIPDNLVNGLVNEEGQLQKPALQHLLSQLAVVIHGNVQREMQGYVSGSLTAYEQRQSQAQQLNTMNKDYFGTYPQHDNPAVVQMVQQEASALHQQTNAPWSPAFRDALAARVNARIAAAQAAGFYTPAPVTTPPQPAVPAAPTPAPFVAPTTRGAAGEADAVKAFMRSTILG